MLLLLYEYIIYYTSRYINLLIGIADTLINFYIWLTVTPSTNIYITYFPMNIFKLRPSITRNRNSCRLDMFSQTNGALFNKNK